jgi:hypothetical protein
MGNTDYEKHEGDETMGPEEAFALEVKKLYDALKAEGFNSGWAGDFVKGFFHGAASK